MRVRPRYVFVASAAALVSLLAVAGLDFGRPAEGEAIKPNDPAQVALGEKLYGAQCAPCHGGDLQGQPDWQRREERNDDG